MSRVLCIAEAIAKTNPRAALDYLDSPVMRAVPPLTETEREMRRAAVAQAGEARRAKTRSG